MNIAERGIIFDEKVVVKPGKVPAFFIQCPRVFMPPRVYQYDGAYAYQFVAGRRATVDDVPHILRIARQEFWQVRPDRFVHPVTIEKYVQHVTTQAAPYPEAAAVVAQALDILGKVVHPTAKITHGDLTFENVIVTDRDDLVFIDPADSRGMNTPSVDRGKLLQSIVMRWEERHTVDVPWTRPGPFPGWASDVDWAFLVTHWIRLMRYWPELDTRSGFAALEKVGP